MAHADCTRPFRMGEPRIDDLLVPEHILAVMHECENTVRWKMSVQNFELNTLRWASTIRKQLRDGTYESMGFRRFDITERGKLRHIQAVHISERAVQKLLCQYALQPVIYPRLIYDNSACQVNKGTEFALKRLVEHLRWHLQRYGKNGTVVIMDYHGFFNSIPHAKATEATQAHQPDPMIRQLIADFINAFDGDCGLGLGSEISQIVAALYPTPIDRFVKEQLQIHCYARYNDDSYIIHPDREYALYCLEEVTKKAAEFGLTIHRSKTRVHNLASDDFEYLKKRIHITDRGRIILRLSRKNIQREEARIRMQRREYDAGRMPFMAILQSYQCWRNYAQTYNAHGAVGNMDRYFLSVMGDLILKETGKEHIRFGHPRPPKEEDIMKTQEELQENPAPCQSADGDARMVREVSFAEDRAEIAELTRQILDVLRECPDSIIGQHCEQILDRLDVLAAMEPED